jgi:squalene cyclase
MSWSSSGEELKAYLGLNGMPADQAARIQLFLEVAIKKADEYLEWDFVVNRARWLIGDTVSAGNSYTLKVRPEDPSGYTEFSASYTASAGDSPQKVAYELRKSLATTLLSRKVTVSGAGAAIEVATDDQSVAMEASNVVSGGTITQKLFDASVPVDVRFGVYEYVRALKVVFRRTPGVISKKTAVLAETYAQDGSPAKEAFSAAKGYWSQHKAHPLLDGGGRA